MQFLKDIMTGNKEVSGFITRNTIQFLKNDEVIIVNVPRIPEFQSKKLEQEAMEDQELSSFLPEPKFKRPLPKQYLYNVINSIKPDFFPDNILHAMKKRSHGANEV